MTPDERLNQLEPLISEALAVLDRHTAQLKQHTGLLNQLITLASRQSDNIDFILREQVSVKAQQATMQIQLTDVQTQQATMQTQLTDVQSQMTEMQTQQGNVNMKLDLILSKLDR